MPDAKQEPESQARYQRILLKLSGEALAGEHRFGFDFDVISKFASDIKEVAALGVGVGLVIGGGNIVRGAQISRMGMDRVAADYMGMLGTVINALAMCSATSRASSLKSSVRATKSVSQLSSTSTPTLPLWWM